MRLMRSHRLSAVVDGAEHPCRAQGACVRHCNMLDNWRADGEHAPPPARRHGRGTRVGSIRSAVQHDRSATANVARSADLGCPCMPRPSGSLGAGSRADYMTNSSTPRTGIPRNTLSAERAIREPIGPGGQVIGVSERSGADQPGGDNSREHDVGRAAVDLQRSLGGAIDGCQDHERAAEYERRCLGLGRHASAAGRDSAFKAHLGGGWGSQHGTGGERDGKRPGYGRISPDEQPRAAPGIGRQHLDRPPMPKRTASCSHASFRHAVRLLSRTTPQAGHRATPAADCRCPSRSTAYCPCQRRERDERHDAGGDPGPPPPTARAAWLAQQVVERAVLNSIGSLRRPHLRALGRQVRAPSG